MRSWTLVFAALTAVLSAALLFQVRANGRLRDDIVALTESRARAAGLEPGKVLGPFTLRDAAGKEVQLDFAGEFVGTVLLFHASSCQACENSIAHWERAIRQAARPDVRVLCIQTDVFEGRPLALDGLPASLSVPLPPVGWLAALPAVPATLVVDEHGVLRRAWYRELDAGMAAELEATIDGLGATAAAPAPR